MVVSSFKKDVVAYARSLGFERIGVARTDALPREEAHLKSWLAEGYAGTMDYMVKNPERRARPMELLEGARSVITLAVNYHTDAEAMDESNKTLEGRFSRYSSGRDYHKVLGKRLEAFMRYLQALAPGVECRSFLDTGPLLERAFAQRAGLGFIGKNAMLITRGMGSWVFLASVVTTLDLDPDAPDNRSCGECTRCIDACPTEAITAPFEIDARRCIAYLTIENKGDIPATLRPRMQGWVFGCDICQEVCPHNARPEETTLSAFKRQGDFPGLRTLLSIRTDEDFGRRFSGTPIVRAGRRGLVRNACIAAANLGRHDLLPDLQHIIQEDTDPIVRVHAAWAASQLS